jgi:fatty-acyl-CoA synthase
MLRGMMMDRPLLVSSVIDYAAEIFPDVQVVSQTVEGGLHRYGYAQARERIGRLANALVGLGIKPWRSRGDAGLERLPPLRALLRDLGHRRRLPHHQPAPVPEQITYIANHAEDTALFFDLTFLPLVEKLAPASSPCAPMWR